MTKRGTLLGRRISNHPPCPCNHPVFWSPPSPSNSPLLFVIPSVPGFPTSPLLPATTYVVLFKENHMQLTEAATLDRKSGAAEGSAVPLPLQTNPSQLRISCINSSTTRCSSPVNGSSGIRG